MGGDEVVWIPGTNQYAVGSPGRWVVMVCHSACKKCGYRWSEPYYVNDRYAGRRCADGTCREPHTPESEEEES